MKKLLLIALLGATFGSAWGAAAPEGEVSVTFYNNSNQRVEFNIQPSPTRWSFLVPVSLDPKHEYTYTGNPIRDIVFVNNPSDLVYRHHVKKGTPMKFLSGAK